MEICGKRQNETNNIQPPPPLARCVPHTRNRGRKAAKHQVQTTETTGDQAEARCLTRCALIVQYSSMSSLGKLDSGSHELCSGP